MLVSGARLFAIPQRGQLIEPRNCAYRTVGQVEVGVWRRVLSRILPRSHKHAVDGRERTRRASNCAKIRADAGMVSGVIFFALMEE